MILEALKVRTAASHRNVEASLLLQPLVTRTLHLENYAQILRKFYGFFQPLEAEISRLPQLEYYVPDLADRRKSSRLLTDLEQVTRQPVTAKDIPVCQNIPPVTNVSEGLGALYVMEGSTLGGKIMAKIIRETLGFTPENGTTFFSGYGAQTGSKWKAFQEALTHYAAATDQGDAVVTAAAVTFRELEKWFAQMPRN